MFLGSANPEILISALVWISRCFYLLYAGVSALLMAPRMNGFIVAHGKNLMPSGSGDDKERRITRPNRIEMLMVKNLKRLRLMRKIPKAYFTHFYIVGSCVSAISLYKLLRLAHLASKAAHNPRAIDLSPMLLAEAMISVQTLRRLLECLLVTRTTKYSRMLALQYIVGLFYYVLVPLTPFVEQLSSFSHENQHLGT